MLAHRVIPTLLCRGRQLVKGKQFNSWRSVGVAAQAVRIHQARGVDELCLLDIGATPENRGPDLDLVAELSEVCFMPLAVGGGIRNLYDAKALLRAGADKVVVGAGGPKVIKQIADVYGNQAVIAAVDVKNGRAWRRCGQEDTGRSAVDYADDCWKAGAGEILLTAIDHEGTLSGYALGLVRSVSKAVDVPVIAHGGCGSYEHMRQVIEAGADAVAAGAFFQFEDATPIAAAKYLHDHHIEARI